MVIYWGITDKNAWVIIKFIESAPNFYAMSHNRHINDIFLSHCKRGVGYVYKIYGIGVDVGGSKH